MVIKISPYIENKDDLSVLFALKMEADDKTVFLQSHTPSLVIWSLNKPIKGSAKDMRM